MENPRAVIIGASSGIGEALAQTLSNKGYHVALVARREVELARISGSLKGPSTIAVIDVSDSGTAMEKLKTLIDSLVDVELFIISAGVGFVNPELKWQDECTTLATNVTGFTAIANVAVNHLQDRGSGQLVGISSIAALRGHGDAPAYGASKAFVSNYLQGIRHRFAKLQLPVNVLDVQPGFVDTAMAKGENLFWVAPPLKAAKQIVQAIEKRKNQVYVTKRWRIIAWLIRLMPDWLYHRI